MKRIVLAVAAALSLSLSLSVAARADHYMQTADPNVVNAINQIVYALGQGCNAGNAQACQAIPMAQQQAHMMLTAGYDCQAYGNQQACMFYQQNLVQLEQAYYQVQAAAQSGALMMPQGSMGGVSGGGMGLTHAQRMQEIHNMGVANTMRYQQRQQMMDTNHQNFIDMIRQ